MNPVDKSFAHCRRVARSRARNFYYSFSLLPREKKLAMCAVYAFMRYSDDISDNSCQSLVSRQIALVRWRTAFKNALQGQYGDDPILPSLHHTVVKYQIPEQYFFELIDGVGSDLVVQRQQTFDDLYQYCYRVASVVGMTCVHIFGYDSPAALQLAEKCGVAFQLTNILRDIPEDARLGRLYLPEQDLERFGLRPKDLIEGRGGLRFRKFMEFECSRAERYYREAAPLLMMVHHQGRPALWAMMSIYYRILQRIRQSHYDVYTKRARLSAFEKVWIVLQALRFRLVGGAPPFPA